MKIENFTNSESIESFIKWWQERVKNHDAKKPNLPNFFEVWDARQIEIDRLKKENAELKNTIEKLKSNK